MEKKKYNTAIQKHKKEFCPDTVFIPGDFCSYVSNPCSFDLEQEKYIYFDIHGAKRGPLLLMDGGNVNLNDIFSLEITYKIPLVKANQKDTFSKFWFGFDEPSYAERDGYSVIQYRDTKHLIRRVLLSTKYIQIISDYEKHQIDKEYRDKCGVYFPFEGYSSMKMIFRRRDYQPRHIVLREYTKNSSYLFSFLNYYGDLDLDIKNIISVLFVRRGRCKQSEKEYCGLETVGCTIRKDNKYFQYLYFGNLDKNKRREYAMVKKECVSCFEFSIIKIGKT